MNQAPAASQPQETVRPHSTLSWLKRLAKKELSEILRDRRTIITLVLMPILVYPLLSVAFRTLALSGVTVSGEQISQWRIEFEDTDDFYLLDSIFQGELGLQEKRRQDFEASVVNGKGGKVSVPEIPLWEIWVKGENSERIEANVRDGLTDLGVHIDASLEAQKAGKPIEIVLFSSETSVSREAREWFSSRIRKVNDDFRIRELQQLNRKVTTVLALEDREIKAEAAQSSNISFAALMPLILVLMTITGAVYPAIDLTAGERERNTLEALIASPAPRFALLLAKYTAVLTVAMLTALMNLTAMSTTIWLLGLGKEIFGAGGFSFLAVVEVAGLMILFAAFFSGVLLAVTSFARSFKEAQAYLIPLMLIALAPGMMSLMPGIALEDEKGMKPLVVAPLVNLVLLTRDLLLNKASLSVAAVVVFSTALYAMAAIALAARVFGADSVLYGREGSWTELFTRPREVAKKPSVSAAFFCLAALFVVTFLTQSVLAKVFAPKGGEQFARLDLMFLASGLGNFLIFGGTCLLFAWLGRIAWTSILPMRPPTILVSIAVLFLGAACWPIAHEILAWMSDLGIAPIKESHMAKLSSMLDKWEKIPPWITITSIAIITPIGEEIAFRGYLYSAFVSSKRPTRAIFISAFLFAAFHVVAPGVLQFERFAPSFFMGLVLGFVRYRSNSIWPSLCIHMAHNGLLLLFAANRTALENLGFGVAANSLHLPILWQLVSLTAVAFALALVWVSKGKADKITVAEAAN